MDKVRRLFLKVLGLAPVVTTMANANASSQTEPEIKPEVNTLDLKFHAYKSPELVGWKGYWYKEAPCVLVPGVFGKTSLGKAYEEAYVRKPHIVHEIMAFETLDGKRVASPFVMQGESSHQARYRG